MHSLHAASALLAGLFACAATAHAQNVGITYQGRLKSAGMPVNGAVDLRFVLYNAATGNTALAPAINRSNVPVVDGVFTVQLGFDPDAINGGNQHHLEIAVANPSGSSAFVTLSPRQPLTAAPYAIQTRGIDYDDGDNIMRLGTDRSDRVGIGTATPSERFHVLNSDPTRDTVALFENANGSARADGIAIKIDNGTTNGSTNRENNFITFLNGRNVVVGRVEGFDLQNGDWIAPPPIPSASLSVTATTGRLPRLTFDPGALPTASLNRGTLPSLTCSGGAWPRISCSGGVWPSVNCANGSFSAGSLPRATFTTRTILGFSVPTSFSFSRGTLPSTTFPTCTLSGGAFPGCTFDLRGARFPTCSLSRGSLPSLSFGRGRLPSVTSFDPGQLPAVTGVNLRLPTASELQTLACWATDTDNAGTMAFMAAYGMTGNSSAAALIAQASQACRDEGVVYGSKGADYAEWLPKMNADDSFQLGQVVGVRDGKVTLDTEGAEQLMVISCKPCVLGNIPADGEESDYVKVAFMGQVPVVVRGRVNTGDYIIPSEYADGTAVAVTPEDIEVEHLDRIVGRAWSSSDSDVYGMVNVVVGVEGFEAAIALRKQGAVIREQRDEIASLRAELESLRSEHVAVHDRLDAIEQALATVAPAAAKD